MPGIKFTKENLLERARLEPGWYMLDIKEFNEAISKGGDSTNWIGQFVVAAGPMAGTPIRLYFNEKAMGRLTDFMLCFTKDENSLLGKEVIELLKQTIGRKIKGHCHFDPEFKWNTIDEFQPAEKAAA